MSRSHHGAGTTLADALRDAVADLLDVPTADLSLALDARAAERWTGQARLELEVAAAPAEPENRDEDTDGARRRAGGARPAAERGGRDDQAGSREDDAPDERGDDERGEDEPVLTQQDLDDEADAAADFLEGLLDALDLPGDIRIRTTEDHAEVEVVEIGSGALIGRRGQTLEAIQELVRCALQREFQRRSRVKVDAEGYRSRRLEKLIEKAEEAIDEVIDTGEPVRLEPMDVFERKSVHRIVGDVEGVESRSQGREPARRVVISPA